MISSPMNSRMKSADAIMTCMPMVAKSTST